MREATGPVIGRRFAVLLLLCLVLGCPSGGVPDAWGGQKEAYLGAGFSQGDDGGIVVRRVDAGGPAQKAGLAVGDRIAGADGKTLEGSEALVEHVLERKPGDKMALKVQRGVQAITLTIILGENAAD